MKVVWNVSPHGLVIDPARTAVKPCGSVLVDDDIAQQLVSGPDWSYTNPRPPRGRPVTDAPAKPATKE